MGLRSSAEPSGSGTVERDQYGSDVIAGKLYLSSGWAKIPHPDKAETGGEDALFVMPSAVGIADGVGGWANQGVDAGEVSRALMRSAQALAMASPYQLDGLGLLRQAWACVEEQQIVGSTTAVIAALVAERLYTANLGDSGFIVYRDSVALYRTEPMVHAFNFPLQLGTGSIDTPRSSDLWKLDVAEGDLLLMSTDGLFDNLYPNEIDSIVYETMSSSDGMQNEMRESILAEKVLAAALDRSFDTGAVCPFVDEARAEGYVDEIGGKLDDITVLVAVVKRAS